MADLSLEAPPSTTDGLVLRAEDLWVSYRAYQSRSRDLRSRLTRPWQGREFITVEAVRGVSFSLARGEALGIIGSNGSGKTTLLRALAGLQTPTTGAVWGIAYPVLLGVGPALKPGLTGRRNIRLGALALGLSRSQVAEYEPHIIEFAALGEAIDRPMKTYSQGMRQRLQFAIATAVQPQILLLDEALAVGDRAFKKRSLRRLKELRQNAAAVVLVAHAMGEIRHACDRALWLDEGRIRAEGEPDRVIEEYEAQ